MDAAALTPPGQPVGLLAKDTLVGGLVYYGERPVHVLATPERAATFLAEGGRAVVVAERDLEALQRLAPIRIWSRARSGARALLVVAPR